jgi:hypothetical protein
MTGKKNKKRIEFEVALVVVVPGGVCLIMSKAHPIV